jgi:hypothetical protein
MMSSCTCIWSGDPRYRPPCPIHSPGEANVIVLKAFETIVKLLGNIEHNTGKTRIEIETIRLKLK